MREELKFLRQTFANVTRRIVNMSGTQIECDYDEGWHDAITEVLKIIESETKISVDEIIGTMP